MNARAISRHAGLACLTIAVLTVSGCGWFGKGGTKDAYKLSGEARPLEVPPDLDRPGSAGAMALPGSGGSVMASQMGAGAAQPAASASSFQVAGQRDAVFAKIGQAMAGIPGVTIASQAQLLGTYDITYNGASFLVRTTQNGESVMVSAVDPRGVAAQGAQATDLLAQLRAALGGH